MLRQMEPMEAGLAAEKAQRDLGREEVAQQTSWILRRNLAYICWRLVDLDPARADAASLLRRAIELTEEAGNTETESQHLNASLNLLLLPC